MSTDWKSAFLIDLLNWQQKWILVQNSNVGKPLRVATFEENWLMIDNKDFDFFVRFRKTSGLFLRPDFREVWLEGWVGIYDLKEKF